ncbi:NADP oxidoreductase [Candidatus Sumerlaeota bacterium]|nr:NADP oxidoreductase [Candidatus Sumerlaeota bacterium]
MSKPRLASIWLDGCSGCHMSLIDLDDQLFALAEKVDVVFGPLVDTKEFPEGVDITLVEGAVSTDEDHEVIKLIRQRTKYLVALGDCAVTTNIPGMRNSSGTQEMLQGVYPEAPAWTDDLPKLQRALPLHAVVKVDVHLPGCPPPPEMFFAVIAALLEDRIPDVQNQVRFGM